MAPRDVTGEDEAAAAVAKGAAAAVEAALAARRKAAVAPATPPAEALSALEFFKDRARVYRTERSTVWRATHAETGGVYAIKGYTKSVLTAVEEQQVNREFAIGTALPDHPCLLRPLATFSDADCSYLVQRYAEQGDLFGVVAATPDGTLPEAYAAQVLLQITAAVAACHECDVIHRDIKPENSVIDAEGLCKLMDFGLAINVQTQRPVSRVGTLDYLAPEVVGMVGSRAERVAALEWGGASGFYDAKVDVWALGVLAFELLAGRAPFAAPDGDSEGTEDAILAARGMPAGLRASPAAVAFVQACLQPAPRRRPTAHELLRMPWLQGAVKSLEYCPMLLTCVPGRGGVSVSAGARRVLAAVQGHLEHAKREAAAAAAAGDSFRSGAGSSFRSAAGGLPRQDSFEWDALQAEFEAGADRADGVEADPSPRWSEPGLRSAAPQQLRAALKGLHIGGGSSGGLSRSPSTRAAAGGFLQRPSGASPPTPSPLTPSRCSSFSSQPPSPVQLRAAPVAVAAATVASSSSSSPRAAAAASPRGAWLQRPAALRRTASVGGILPPVTEGAEAPGLAAEPAAAAAATVAMSTPPPQPRSSVWLLRRNAADRGAGKEPREQAAAGGGSGEGSSTFTLMPNRLRRARPAGLLRSVRTGPGWLGTGGAEAAPPAADAA